MSKKRKKPGVCWYCGCLVSGTGVGDHFPAPKCLGGKNTIPCCQSCHDMKDRYNINQWPIEWTYKVIEDMPKLSRESKLWLAKMLKVMMIHFKDELGISVNV